MNGDDYDFKQDVFEMLTDIMNHLAQIKRVYRNTRSRALMHAQSSPTPKVFDRILPAMDRLLEVCMEQLGVLWK
jgi:hypothetical protein